MSSIVTELSTREKEILNCYLKGKNQREIASKFSIAVSTVKTHTSNIFSKQDYHSLYQMVAVESNKRYEARMEEFRQLLEKIIDKRKILKDGYFLTYFDSVFLPKFKEYLNELILEERGENGFN